MSDMWIDVDTAVAIIVNESSLLDDTDFKTRETGVAYNAAGMDLAWNFTTSAGVVVQTAVTPTTAGVYDWTHVGGGIYKIEMPASGGGSINNDAEGYGFFSGFVTGVVPWVSPVYGFRAAALNDALCDGGDSLDVNTVQISGDSTAAENLELQYDGTGITGDTFPATQAQVGSLAVGAGGISTVAESATITTGTQTLTYTSTVALDGVTHDVAADGGVTDFYYQFDVGVTGVATEVIWDGYAQSNNDSYAVYGYDWVAVAWVQIGTKDGANGTAPTEDVYILNTSMTGIAANVGKVRVRFESSDAVEIFTDRILCEYTSLPEAGSILHSGVAQAGTSNTITLDAGASALDGFYSHTRIILSSGTGEEQERLIVDYKGSTKIAKVAPPWITIPDATSVFEVEPGLAHSETGWPTIKVGLAAGATSTTITLDSDASSLDDYYNLTIIQIDAGTGAGQSMVITDYNGTTKVATVDSAWQTTPDTTSEYIVEDGLSITGALTTTAKAEVNAECDLAISDANLATAANLATVDTNVDAILVDTSTTLPAQIAALNDISVADLMDATVEGSYSLVESLRLQNSVLLGKVSGGGTVTEVFRDISDTKARVTATVDEDGNRTAITLDES